MKKESFQGILLGVVIMCAVFAFITIAWAAFSSTLSISGTATVKKQKWAVEFTDDPTKDFATSKSNNTYISLVNNTNMSTSGQVDTTSTYANFGLTSSDMAGGTISSQTYNKMGQLNVGGDEITYTWYARNFGTFDAYAVLNTTSTTGFFTSMPSDLSSATPANAGTGNIQVTCSNADSSITAQAAQAWCNSYIEATVLINGTAYNGTGFNILKDDGAAGGNDQVTFALKIKFLNTGGTDSLPVTCPGNIDITVPTFVLTVNQGTTVVAGP